MDNFEVGSGGPDTDLRPVVAPPLKGWHADPNPEEAEPLSWSELAFEEPVWDGVTCED